MAGEFEEFFTELMFGSGAWFGLILFVAIGFIVSYKAKYSSIIFLLFYVFLFFEYFDAMGGAIAVDSTFMWACIIDLVALACMGAMFYNNIVSNRK